MHFHIHHIPTTADLEMQYLKADKRYKQLIAESIKLDDQGNVLQKRKIDAEAQKAYGIVYELGKQLTKLCEKEQKL